MRNVSPGMKTVTRRRKTLSVRECITSGGNGTSSSAGTTLSQTFFTPNPPILPLYHVQQRHKYSGHRSPSMTHRSTRAQTAEEASDRRSCATWVICYWGGFLLFSFYSLTSFNVLTCHVLVLMGYDHVSKVFCIHKHRWPFVKL